VGNRIAEHDIGEIQLAGINMQAKTDLTRGKLGNAANRRDDSREHG
jgi:hypothetical protein